MYATAKNQQISSLFHLNQGVRKINDDTFEVPCFAGQQLYFTVLLERHFPVKSPVIKVRPQLSHPWVSPDLSVKGCPSLQSWTLRSDLGRVMADIIRQFQLYPPQVVNQSSGTGYSGYSGQSQQPQSQQQTQAHRPAPQPPQPSQQSGGQQAFSQFPDMPEIPKDFPDLSSLSIEELENLSEHNSDAFFDYLRQLEPVLKIADTEDGLRAECEALARENLDKEPDLIASKARLADKHKKLSQLREQFDEHMEKQQEIAKQYEPKAIIDALRIATQEAEEEAEEIADKFVNGDMDVNEFISVYQEKKKLHHLRHAKEEMLSRQVAR